ncbi:nuclear transport factor 2-like [Zingiber officinale]|uniref:nuclear transport factor 2-like n=1 Tax=Zingiber officinale TaxID=94328 RepID=UPI001C4C6082|nr:nuclear transport factor 2-like [Zingiber officinale]
MAAQPSGVERSPLSAKVVGSTFVDQYYHILQHSPDLLHRFYQESSKLAQPDDHDAMILVTPNEVSNPLPPVISISAEVVFFPHFVAKGETLAPSASVVPDPKPSQEKYGDREFILQLSRGSTLRSHYDNTRHIPTRMTREIVFFPLLNLLWNGMQSINQKVLLSIGHVRAEMNTVDSQESLSGGVTVFVAGYLIGEDNVKRTFIQSFFLAPQDIGFFVLNDIFRFVEEVEHQQLSQDLANGNAELHPAEEAFSLKQEEHALDQTKVPTITPVMVAEPSPVAAQGNMTKKSYASISLYNHSLILFVTSTMFAISSYSKMEKWKADADRVLLCKINAESEKEFSTFNQRIDLNSCLLTCILPSDATPEQLEQEFKKIGPIKPDGVQVRSHKKSARAVVELD